MNDGLCVPTLLVFIALETGSNSGSTGELVIRFLAEELGIGESAGNRLFLGWYSPRGLASIVFAVIVLDNELPGASCIALVVACTAIFSLVLHGITANPTASRMADKH